jgi:hypothetical protein
MVKRKKPKVEGRWFDSKKKVVGESWTATPARGKTKKAKCLRVVVEVDADETSGVRPGLSR